MYCTQEIVAGEKLVNFKNPALFAKIFLAIIHRYTENVFGICPHCNLFANFSLTNTSYLYGSPKFPHVQYLYLNTSKSTCILLKYFSQNIAVYLYLYFTKCQSTCTSLNVKVLVLYLSTFICTSPHAWHTGTQS